MRDPVGSIVPGTAVTIISGNQYQGGGNPGNQLQAGSTMFFKRVPDTAWTPLPLIFETAVNNNKYFAATIPAGTFQAGDVVQYYLRIAYDDHDGTFLQANGPASIATAGEAAARSAPFTFTIDSSAAKGQWGQVFPLPNVGIHAHLLPNGLVLMWGRRDRPDQSLDVHVCTPFLWDPATGQVSNTPQPKLADGTTINLFCSGHAFLADGRLMVAGGHLFDSQGLNQSVIYDPATNAWSASGLMNDGRWYPTVTTLPDGRVVVLSGSFLQNGNTPNNLIPQVWENGVWKSIAPLPDGRAPALYPRQHVASDGRVFMSGPLVQTWLLSVADIGAWTQVAPRDNALRDYSPSVMYDTDKVIYIGGGNDLPTRQPTAAAEIIDLGQQPSLWKATDPMHFARRQHNATLLPDGTVLVTGGTRGGGGSGFNDLAPGAPVHMAELWDPATGKWTLLAAEQVDRCYHATALLLPDATVLSAGGGEYRPTADPVENNPQDSHRDAQIFSPPYLFKGARPVITVAPASVGYGETFTVGTSQSGDIGRVSWIGLSSVTHAFNMNQHINFLTFKVNSGGLQVTVPGSPNVCPPGHYLLFILTRQGVPSVAKIIQVKLPAAAPAAAPASAPASAQPMVASGPMARSAPVMDAFAARAAVVQAITGTAVLLGLTGTCPYGIAACWGGANEALHTLEGVSKVDPIPNADDSTANVYLQDERLPALDRWDQEFHSMVNGSYALRGVEVSLRGTVTARDGGLFLDGRGTRPMVQLAPLTAGDKVQWDLAAAAPKPMEPREEAAYVTLAAETGDLVAGQEVTVTGPLHQSGSDYRLSVRLFSLSA